MSLAAMPWLVANLGGEMLYILEQRLKAQGIAPAKTARVLRDIVGALFDPAFVEGRLLEPQARAGARARAGLPAQSAPHGWMARLLAARPSERLGRGDTDPSLWPPSRRSDPIPPPKP
jgi:hypothetical protein